MAWRCRCNGPASMSPALTSSGRPSIASYPKAAPARRRLPRPPPAPRRSSASCSTRRRPRRCCSATEGCAASHGRRGGVHLLGDHGALGGARPRRAPRSSDGRHYLDAPISGGAQRAAAGELTVLASGSAGGDGRGRRRCSRRWPPRCSISATSRDRRRPQDRQPASRRRPYRGRLRGDGASPPPTSSTSARSSR